MSEMFGLLEQPPEVQDKPDAPALQVQGGSIELRDVHFAYDPERAILKGVSLKVEPGQTLAIVGPSGSGKSTIGRLLFRFYDVTQGTLLVDGQDIRDVTQLSLHEAIGVVPQDTVLFNDATAGTVLRKTPRQQSFVDRKQKLTRWQSRDATHSGDGCR